MNDNQLTFGFADRINEAHQAAQLMAAEAKSHITGAVRKALECGQLMLQKKDALAQSGEGWIDWLTQRCPGISEQNARRYMSLAKRASAIGSSAETDPGALRQAFLATGILGETPKVEGQNQAAQPWVKFTKPLDQFRLWLNARRDQEPMEQWDEQMLRLLSNELKWFINLHAEVQNIRQTLAENSDLHP